MEKLDIRNHKKQWDTRGRTGTVCKNGYRIFSLGSRNNKKREYEHRKVWRESYGEIPKGFHIHHKDGNKLNNSIENLELVSISEHLSNHAKKNNLGKDRVGCEPINKISKEKREQILKLRKEKLSLNSISKIMGLSYPTVQKYAKECL